MAGLENLRILGFGNPLLDISAVVDDAEFPKWKVKAGDIVLADPPPMGVGIDLQMYKDYVKSHEVEYIAGGATQNTIRVAQWVTGAAGATGYVGSVGADENGAMLEKCARADGVNVQYMKQPSTPTGTCAVLVSKEGERALVTNLAAANEGGRADASEDGDEGNISSAEVSAARQQQRGGGGGSTRGGPGEKALLEKKSELAQRRAALRRKLKGSSGRSEGLRGTARARDADAGRRVPRVALVGYTNAGKSALQERLAPRPKLERRASDALFASLDTHSRRGHLASGNEALFVDTVGFIRRLSPGLRGCFEDTLQAAAEADLLLHVLDASSPFLAQQRAAVRATLGALELPPALLSGCIEVYTKADLLDEEARRQWRDALEEEPSDGGALLVSAVDGSGLSELTSAISTQLGARLGRARKTLRLPLDGGAALAQQLAFLHGHPRVAVVEQRDSDDGSALEVVADMDEGTHRMFVGQRWT